MLSDNSAPKLTVLMAVHNGSPYLRTAIDSVLQQTYSNFCFLLVDDASTDDTNDIVRSYQDDRIVLKCLEKNVGQTAALNIGIKLATTHWIARLDADDYSAPTRFEKQMSALQTDSSIHCIGTHVWMFHENPEVVDSVFEPPESHEEIKRGLLRGSSIVHGSIVVDREALLSIGGFDEQYRLVADLEMYDRLVAQYKMANLPEHLVGIRQHQGQTSGTKLAYDEAINICLKRLESGNYTRQEISTIRATLSRAYLYRSRLITSASKFSEQARDLVRAIRISPSTFAWNFSIVYLFGRLSKTYRLALRQIFSNSLPKFFTGR